MLGATVFSVLLLLIGIILVIVNRKQQSKKTKIWFKLFLGTFLTGYLGVSTFVMVLLYGPNPDFKDWLVTTAMSTMSHRYLATWFYNNEIIEEVMSNHIIIESEDNSNPDLIQIGGGENNTSSGTMYANEYEEDILTKNKGNELYKIIDIERKNQKGKIMRGKMAVIYDPSKVKIAASRGMSLDFSVAYGQMVKTMAKQNGGIIGMNASGFNDPKANSKGGVPWGYVISNGKILINNRFPTRFGGGLIGFDKNNKLILAKKTSAKEALAMGIRDGIQYGPFLIVNGKPSYIKGNGGGGYQPRSVIAQRKDGIVLMLVIDGRSTYSNGATYYDLVNVLMDYGAYNAANLDGGTSSSLNLNGEIINKPMNILGQRKTRTVPNAWIVLK